MNATQRSPLKLVKQYVGWNNAKEQMCNQCTQCLSRYLWFSYESGGIFPTSSAVARSRFLAGVAITNISMQLALLYSEMDYLTYNPTSRHGTGYTFTWPRPTVEPVWLLINTIVPHNFLKTTSILQTENLLALNLVLAGDVIDAMMMITW